MNRTVVLGGVLVILIGISAYVWSRSSGDETDSRIASIKELFTCPNCQHQWEMTHDESTKMLMAGNGFVCPKCGQSDARKANPEVVIGGFGVSEEDQAPEEDPGEEQLPTITGGAKLVGE